LTANFDDIWRVTASGSLSMVGMDGAIFKGGDRSFHKPRFI
jgi:hypothetical protein